MSELEIYHCDEWHNPYTEFYLKHEADRVIIQQKRKRCLAMFDKCQVRVAHCQLLERYEERNWWRKWMFKWLELADKLKKEK